MLQLSSLLRGCCMLHRPALSTTTVPLHQSVPRRVCTGVPLVAAAATPQQRQMGWPWPFRNNSSSSSKLQHLLQAATVFSHQPSAEALQDVKAALSECMTSRSGHGKVWQVRRCAFTRTSVRCSSSCGLHCAAEVPFRELGLQDAATQSDVHGTPAAVQSQYPISYQHM